MALIVISLSIYIYISKADVMLHTDYYYYYTTKGGYESSISFFGIESEFGGR